MQLIQVSQFLNQFSLSIYHKPGQLNVFSDTLSRLRSKNTLDKKINPKYNNLGIFYTYNTTLVKINKSFVAKICNEYNNNLAWNETKRVLETNCLLGPYIADLLLKSGLWQLSLIWIILSSLIFYLDKFSG